MTSPAQSKILLLEDDRNLGFMVCEHLKMNNYDVDLCKNGLDGLKALKDNKYDLLLVDIMMPKMDGFTFAREVRSQNDELPIIFLTAKSLQEDKIEGFKIGCDDYITKPFSVDELLLRIQAVLKRTQKSKIKGERHLFEIGKYKFDSKKRLLIFGKDKTKLTSKESELLRLLCLHLDNTLERGLALKNIWGDENYFSGRSMDVFISKLRKYLKSDKRIEIVNIHGKGFRLIING
jgi:DNA-binding response OmpR family regulator